MTKPTIDLDPNHPSMSLCLHPECEGGTVPDHSDPGYWKECPSCHGTGWIDCLDGPDGCGGDPVEFRSVDGYKAWPRCGHHFDQRLAKQDHINELTSPMPAEWFCEADAGEVWSDDDY